MNAPKGATFKESFGTLEVKLEDGKNFFVQINLEADIAGTKKEAEANDVQKIQKFHTDTPETIVFETEAMGRRSIFMNTAVKVGDKTVECMTGRGAHSYTLEQATMMLKACQTLK